MCADGVTWLKLLDSNTIIIFKARTLYARDRSVPDSLAQSRKLFFKNYFIPDDDAIIPDNFNVRVIALDLENVPELSGDEPP